MKKVVLYFTALLLLFAACEKIPQNVKPIDWENYNDVYTVYWNLRSSCKKIKSEYDGRTIKISGWKIGALDLFSLGDDIKWSQREHINIRFCFPDSDAMLDTCDLTKKCFITGKIRLKMEKISGCTVFPEIELTDINDIYFD